jgi:hypothetical protein
VTCVDMACSKFCELILDVRSFVNWLATLPTLPRAIRATNRLCSSTANWYRNTPQPRTCGMREQQPGFCAD